MGQAFYAPNEWLGEYLAKKRKEGVEEETAPEFDGGDVPVVEVKEKHGSALEDWDDEMDDLIEDDE